LEELLALYRLICTPGFNSTLVRLEVIVILFRLISKQFQFHFGSIGSLKTRYILKTWQRFQFHFGSIGSFSINDIVLIKDSFQFHFGSIGRHFFSNFNYFNICFNSTLVRLEELKPVDQKPKTLFQFHFGSIGRNIAKNGLKMPQKFQFHFGSIGRMRELLAV